MRYQRDAFIETIYNRALADKDIFFLSADFGAPSLDIFREKLPDQFIHLGISEQNLIGVAMGLSLQGKKVFTYAMAPFIALRCAEQHKIAAMMDLPIVNLVAGVGVGYANAGPTHYATEDLGLFCSYSGAEVFTTADCATASTVAKALAAKPSFSFVRFDRELCDDLAGFSAIDLNKGYRIHGDGTGLCVLSHGYMLSKLKAELPDDVLGQITLIDVFKNKGFSEELKKVLSKFDKLVFVDEQINCSDLGSILLNVLPENIRIGDVTRFYLDDGYLFDNTGRVKLISAAGLNLKTITDKITSLIG